MVIMNENERDWAIGLDWLGIGLRIGLRIGRRIPAGLVSLAWPSPHSIPHSTSPNSLPSPHSTSI